MMAGMPTDLTLSPNPASVGVPTLVVDAGRLVITGADEPVSFPVTDIGIARFSYRIRNSRTSGLHRSNVMVESRTGQPLAWLANLDVEPYLPGQLEAFAAAAGIPVRDLGEIPSAAVSNFADDIRLGPGTSRVGSVVAPLRQWILCLALIGGATPLALSIVEHWSLGWWLLLVPFWFFGALVVVGALSSKRPADPQAVSRTRGKALPAFLVAVTGTTLGILGHQGHGPVPGWVGVWVGAAALILLSGWLLALQGTWRVR